MITKKFNINWKKIKIEINRNKKAILISILLLVIGIVYTYFAGIYVDKVGDGVPSDIILDNITARDLSIFYVWGFQAVIAMLIFYAFFYRTERLHSIIFHMALLIFVRVSFTCLTHLKVPEDAFLPEINHSFHFLDFRNDLFFSGHAAFSFLGFIFYGKDRIRYFFLIMSILLSITVLVMHIHYTIDVFAAFFITYGTYKIGEWILYKTERKNDSS